MRQVFIMAQSVKNTVQDTPSLLSGSKSANLLSGEFGECDHLIPCQIEYQSSLSFISYPVINQFLKAVISE